MGKNFLNLVGLAGILLGSFLFYIKYKEYRIKTNGKIVVANVTDVQNCNMRLKKYLIDVEYIGHTGYVSVNKSDCYFYALNKNIEVIYNEKENKFISINSNPLRDMLLVSIIAIIGFALLIKGLTQH